MGAPSEALGPPLGTLEPLDGSATAAAEAVSASGLAAFAEGTEPGSLEACEPFEEDRPKLSGTGGIVPSVPPEAWLLSGTAGLASVDVRGAPHFLQNIESFLLPPV